MIRRLLPYPLLALALLAMWMLLAGFTPGQFVVGFAIAVAASHALAALGEASPPIRRWLAIPQFAGIVFTDIVRSNIAVSSILLTGKRRQRRAGFVRIPLRMRSPSGLAILAIVVTSTPGTAWVDYDSAKSELLIHVFDLVEEAEWIEIIGNRYERLLMEIFE